MNVYRSREQALGGTAFGLALAAIGVATAVHLSTTRAVVQSGASVAIALIMAAVFARPRVWTTERGVEIRNSLFEPDAPLGPDPGLPDRLALVHARGLRDRPRRRVLDLRVRDPSP